MAAVNNYNINNWSDYYNHLLNQETPCDEQEKNMSLSSHTQTRNQYYNLENTYVSKSFNCEVCNKSFYTHGQLMKHTAGHVECPFPECKLKADIKIIDQHIDHQHMLINYESLQIDDETWIAERKKRFPTVQRAEIRRAEQMERLKRGERLGKDKKKFSSRKEKLPRHFKGSKQPPKLDHHENQKVQNEKVCSNFKNKKNYRAHSPILIEDPYDSDPNNKSGVPAFKGTVAFFESTGELSLFGLKHANERPTENSLSAMNISDEEDWGNQMKDNAGADKTLQNALGTLINAYDTDSENDKVEVCSDVVKKIDKIRASNDTDKDMNTLVTNECTETKPLTHSEWGNKRKRKHYYKSHRRKFNKDLNTNHKGKFNQKKMHRKTYRRPTLLQKLLEPDIVHERNVILQCIRYIVNNNYFDSSLDNKIHESSINIAQLDINAENDVTMLDITSSNHEEPGVKSEVISDSIPNTVSQVKINKPDINNKLDVDI